MSTPVAVVAAHPDDETVGAASLLLRAAGAVVLHLTDGAPRDPALRPAGAGDRDAYARLRRDEALAALAEAGIGPGRVACLGAVDQEAVEQLAPLARELAAALALLEPRLVVTHPLEGGHPDHDATALAVRAARVLLARQGRAPPLLVEMTSYHLAGGRLVTGAFLAGTSPGVRHRLSAPEEAVKRRMISRYASQAAALSAFGTAEERFRLGAPAAPAARPHAGPLHYEVRGWTTFERFRARALPALDELGVLEASGPDAWPEGPRP